MSYTLSGFLNYLKTLLAIDFFLLKHNQVLFIVKWQQSIDNFNWKEW